MFELFDFYKSEITGTLKNKLTLLGFFSKNGPILHQVFTPELVQRLQQMSRNTRIDPLDSTQQQISSTHIKLYDTEESSSNNEQSEFKREVDTVDLYEKTANKPSNFH